jgi:hypothetical protein
LILLLPPFFESLCTLNPAACEPDNRALIEPGSIGTG